MVLAANSLSKTKEIPMETDVTFAYLLFVCPTVENLEPPVQDLSYSDLLEYFLSSEEQAIEVADLWPNWGETMERFAPVQLTLNWEPRTYIEELFCLCGIGPIFSLRDEAGVGKVLFFQTVPSPETLRLLRLLSEEPHLGTLPDQLRFKELLALTIERAWQKSEGLLFVGDEGFVYESGNEFIADVKHILQQSEFKFYDRHE
jgi:hypothetical protein